jgi:hypothetical protein
MSASFYSEAETVARVARIRSAFLAATPAERAEGKAWYPHALRQAEIIAADSGAVTTAQAVGIIAALSPRIFWRTNVAAARAVAFAVARGDSDCPRVQTEERKAAAWSIARSPGHPLEILSGPKVRAFFANISGDERAVTVDAWAARASEGTDDPPGLTLKRYGAIADAYREAADALGEPPREVQATVWIAIRGKGN